jgi:hypothetical protein
VRPRRILAPFNQFTQRVNVSGDVMSTEPIPHRERPFHVDSRAVAKIPQIGPRECFLSGFKVKLIAIDFNHGQAAPIDANTVSHFRILRSNSRRNTEAAAGRLIDPVDDRSHGFDESGEHGFENLELGNVKLAVCLVASIDAGTYGYRPFPRIRSMPWHQESEREPSS